MLPGFEATAPRRILGAGLVLGVLLSRVALLPDGPWEQDEALFAGAVVDFSVSRHSPHPPGFPGWIVLGKLVHLLVGEPLLALQLASALASTALFCVLAHLLAARHGSGVAVAGALLFSLLPVTWFHAARGFSTTPALACIAGGVLLWRTRTPWRAVAGWALLGLAFTIRPQLAPVLALVAGMEIWRARAHPRRWWPGLAVASFIVLVAYGWAIADTGGWEPYARLAREHLHRHERDVAAAEVWAWSEHGLVRGLGGSPFAGVWLALCLIGGARLLRGREPGDRFVVLLAVVTAATVQGLHHPAFPRYAVATALATTPLVVAGVSWSPRRAAVTILATMTVVAGWLAWPAVSAIHHTKLPIMAALASIEEATPPEATVLYSHGSFSFVRYARSTGKLARSTVDVDRSDPDASGPTAYVGASQPRILPGLTVETTLFEELPDAAWALSQHRFARAFVVRNGVWLGEGAYGGERGQREEPFVWLGARATLHVPGGARRLVLSVELDRGMAPQAIEAYIAERRVGGWTLTEPGFGRLELALDECDAICRVRLEMPGARVGENDHRMLSVRLRAAWVEGPAFPIPRREWNPGLPGSLLASDVELTGFHRPDRFMKARVPGAWTAGHATMRFPARPGRLRLSLARPKHLEGPVHLRSGASEVTVEPGTMPEDVWIDIAAPGGLAHVEIEAPSFVPHERDPSRGDDRELGVIVLGAELVPNP